MHRREATATYSGKERRGHGGRDNGGRKARDQTGKGRTRFTLPKEQQLEHALVRLPHCSVLLDPLLNLVVHLLCIRLLPKPQHSLLQRLPWRWRHRRCERVLGIHRTTRAIHVSRKPQTSARAASNRSQSVGGGEWATREETEREGEREVIYVAPAAEDKTVQAWIQGPKSNAPLATGFSSALSLQRLLPGAN